MSRKLFGVGIAVSGMLLSGAFARADESKQSKDDEDMAAVKDEAPENATPSPPSDEAPKNLLPVPAPRGAVTVIFRNDVGKRFQMVGARFTLDGIALPAFPSNPDPGQEYVILAGEMSSGRHVLSGRVRFRGRSRAIFTYLKGYVLDIDTQQAIYSVSGVPAKVRIVATDRKGFSVPFEKSVAVAVEEQLPPATLHHASDVVETLR
jgi:hypothetical protein